MAELSPVPLNNKLPEPAEQSSRVPTEAEVDLVVNGANKLAEIVQRTEMQRISVSMDGVEWTVEAPGPAPVSTVVAAAPIAAPAAIAAAPAPTSNAATATPAPAAAPSGPAGHPLTSPLVGVFYRAKNPGSAPFVEVGDTVTNGQQVAIVEAMKLLNEVSATRAGTVTAIHVEDGEVVEYGQVLFTIDPA
jgi:acetyl-CoA carboxylase biotin carboxyl carrier protein